MKMRKILILNMFLSLLISLFCIIGVVNSTKIVYAKIDKNVIDEYTLDGIKNSLNNEEKEYITQKHKLK